MADFRKLRVGFDIDDVLFDTAKHVATMYNAAFGTNLTQDDWYSKEFTNWGIASNAVVFERVNDILGSDEFIDTVPVMAGAQRAIKKLDSVVEALFAITGRPHTIDEATLKLLDTYYKGLFAGNTVFFTDFLGQKGTAGSKALVAEQLQLTHFVDDHPDHVNALAAAGFKTVLFSDYKWSRGVELHPDVVKIGDWDELEAYFEQEAKKEA